MKTPLSKTPLVAPLLFQRIKQVNARYNMSQIVGDRFMSEMHLRQRGFTCSAFGPFTKNKERI